MIGKLAAAKRERLQHPGQPEVVVGVVVREEDLAQLEQPDVRAHELALGPLGAVDQQPVAAAAQEERRRRAAPGRHRAGGAEEDDVEIHVVILPVEASGAQGGVRARSAAGSLEPRRRLKARERLACLRKQWLRVLDLALCHEPLAVLEQRDRQVEDKVEPAQDPCGGAEPLVNSVASRRAASSRARSARLSLQERRTSPGSSASAMASNSCTLSRSGSANAASTASTRPALME